MRPLKAQVTCGRPVLTDRLSRRPLQPVQAQDADGHVCPRHAVPYRGGVSDVMRRLLAVVARRYPKPA